MLHTAIFLRFLDMCGIVLSPSFLRRLAPYINEYVFDHAQYLRDCGLFSAGDSNLLPTPSPFIRGAPFNSSANTAESTATVMVPTTHHDTREVHQDQNRTTKPVRGWTSPVLPLSPRISSGAPGGGHPTRTASLSVSSFASISSFAGSDALGDADADLSDTLPLWPLEGVHLEEIEAKVKQLNIIPYTEGTSLFIQARKARDMSRRKEALHLAGLARQKFVEALRYNLNDCQALCNLSFLMGSFYEQHAESQELLKRAIAANPFHVRSWYYLALSYRGHDSRSNLGEMKRCLLEAITLSGESHPNALKDYANLLHYDKKDLDEAEVYYRKALDIKPDHVKSLENFALLLMKRAKQPSDYEYPIELLARAARSDWNNPSQHTYFSWNKFLTFSRLNAELLTLHGQIEAAVRQYEEALDVCPTSHTLQRAYGNFLRLYTRDMDKAELFLRKALESRMVDPEDQLMQELSTKLDDAQRKKRALGGEGTAGALPGSGDDQPHPSAVPTPISRSKSTSSAYRYLQWKGVSPARARGPGLLVDRDGSKASSRSSSSSSAHFPTAVKGHLSTIDANKDGTGTNRVHPSGTSSNMDMDILDAKLPLGRGTSQPVPARTISSQHDSIGGAADEWLQSELEAHVADLVAPMTVPRSQVSKKGHRRGKSRSRGEAGENSDALSGWENEKDLKKKLLWIQKKRYRRLRQAAVYALELADFLWKKRSKLEEAAECLQSAVLMSNQDSRVIARHGQFLFEALGQLEAAEECFSRAIYHPRGGVVSEFATEAYARFISATEGRPEFPSPDRRAARLAVAVKAIGKENLGVMPEDLVDLEHPFFTRKAPKSNTVIFCKGAHGGEAISQVRPMIQRFASYFNEKKKQASTPSVNSNGSMKRGGDHKVRLADLIGNMNVGSRGSTAVASIKEEVELEQEWKPVRSKRSSANSSANATSSGRSGSSPVGRRSTQTAPSLTAAAPAPSFTMRDDDFPSLDELLSSEPPRGLSFSTDEQKSGDHVVEVAETHSEQSKTAAPLSASPSRSPPKPPTSTTPAKGGGRRRPLHSKARR